jgi:hypothetical protein
LYNVASLVHATTWRGWILFFAFSIPAISADVDPTSLLARVREKVADNARRVPRYLCRQNIERKQFILESEIHTCTALIEEKGKKPEGGFQLASTDRANLDVILAATKEMFSWPGGRRFDTENPGRLLSGGLSGSGDFANFLIDIFSVDAVTFHYEGARDGASWVRFNYEVPIQTSQYVLKIPGRDFTVGYGGTFDVDPRTADLLRVVVIATDLDRLLPEVCEVRTQMSYTRAATETGDFMVPASTERDELLNDASYFENRISYQGCRQYGAESVVKFGDDAPKAPSTEVQAARVTSIPPGTELELRLLTNIDSEVNSAGDGIEAAIVKRARDAAGRVTAPAGTIIRGHITQMERRVLPRKEVIIGMRFDRMILGESEVPLALAPRGEMDGRGRGVFIFHEGRAVLGGKFISHWVVRPPQEAPK